MPNDIKPIVTPEQIASKAKKLLDRALPAWLQDDPDFFPSAIRCCLRPRNVSVPDYIESVRRLRECSKAVQRQGYRVEYSFRKLKVYGQNDHPTAIYFDTIDDVCFLAGELDLLQRLRAHRGLLTQRFEQLAPSWLAANWKQASRVSAQDFQGLLRVVDYLQRHPRPGCYLRELPLDISTKLVERHASLLSSLLEQIVPSAINFGCDQNDFEARLGFRKRKRLIPVRLLDSALQSELAWPSDTLGMLPSDLAAQAITNCRVILVENATSLYALPKFHRTLAMGGLGNNYVDFGQLPWLQTCQTIYWGDIDAAGLAILSRVRKLIPHVKSILMDNPTLHQFRRFWTPPKRKLSKRQRREHRLSGLVWEHLYAHEKEALKTCTESDAWLEQEHIPQLALLEALRDQGFDPAEEICR